MTIAAITPEGSSQGAVTFSHALDGAMDTSFGLNDATTTEVLLVRHGEPDYRPSAVNGTGAPPLSERGRCQAMKLAVRLRKMGFDAVYTSTERVAVETATLVAAAGDLPTVRAPELRDLAFNAAALNGAAADPQKLAAELCVRFINNPRWDSLRGVEPTRQFRRRAVQAVEAIVSRHEGQCVVIVTHQPIINAYVSMVLGIERDMFFQPEFTSLSTVRVLRDLYAVQGINDYAHLLTEFAPKVIDRRWIEGAKTRCRVAWRGTTTQSVSKHSTSCVGTW